MRISSLFLALIFAAAGSLLGETISVQPSTLNVGEGQTFSLDVAIANVTDLYAFQFDLGFDPTILEAESVTEGSFLSSGGSTIFFPGTIDNVGGTIAFNADTLVGAIAGVSGSGTLASVEFYALGTGTSVISLANVELLDSNFNLIDFSATNGSVISTIPEPSSSVFIGAALLLLALRQRKVGHRQV